MLEQPERTDWTREATYTVTHQKDESVRTDRWRYSRWGETGEELYDVQADPEEFNNLAKNAAQEPVLREMRKVLQDARERSKL